MIEKRFPSIGTRVQVGRFHVSQLNVRVQERFGESEEDKALVHQLWLGKKIISPFKARPEGEWLKILELSPKMQEATRKGLLSYTEG